MTRRTKLAAQGDTAREAEVDRARDEVGEVGVQTSNTTGVSEATVGVVAHATARAGTRIGASEESVVELVVDHDADARSVARESHGGGDSERERESAATWNKGQEGERVRSEVKGREWASTHRAEQQRGAGTRRGKVC